MAEPAASGKSSYSANAIIKLENIKILTIKSSAHISHEKTLWFAAGHARPLVAQHVCTQSFGNHDVGLH